MPNSKRRLEKADATGLPVADVSADLICGLQIYAYVPELDAALSEARRTLKTGGRLIILDTDFESVVWESHDRARMLASSRLTTHMSRGPIFLEFFHASSRNMDSGWSAARSSRY